jgi:chemotaxis protein MotB
MHIMIRYLTYATPLLALTLAFAAAAPSTADKTVQQLRVELSGDQAEIQKLRGEMKVTILDDLLFPEGSAEITSAGKVALLKLLPTLKALQDTKVVVAGYTDNLPIIAAYRDRYPTNWELGAARSASVVRFLQANGVNPDLLCASSFGSRHAVASNDTLAGQSRNRRTELLLIGPGT